MQKKQTDFEAWGKEVTENWKHVDSLKGKQAKRNLGILRIILESPHSLSMWELALEYLKITQPKFNTWENRIVFYERQKENAQMSRRLKFLLEKGYVRKEGSQYRLSFKGLFLIFILDPKLTAEKGGYCLDDIEDDFGRDYLVDDLRFPKDYLSNQNFQANAKNCMENLLKDPAVAAAASAFFKRRLFGWKVNLDEISKEELVGFIISQKKHSK